MEPTTASDALTFLAAARESGRWAARLAEALEEGELGAGVLFVDDERAADLANEGLRPLEEVVRRLCDDPRSDHPFKIYATYQRQWGRVEELPPPTLPLLAVAVLAASRMVAGDEVAAHNYYARFRQALGWPPQGGQPSSFENLNTWWHDLERWLRLRGRTRLRLSASPRLPYVGLPLSQCLWRDHDDAVLHRFIAVLPPASRAAPAEQVLELLRYSPHRTRLSRGARQAFEVAELRELLVRSVETALERPPAERTAAAPAARVVRRIRLRLGLAPGAKAAVVAKRDPMWGERSEVSDEVGEPVSFRLNLHTVVLHVPVTEQVLRDGLELSVGARQLVLPEATFRLLQKDASFGGWLETTQLDDETEQMMAFPQSLRAAVQEVVRFEAGPKTIPQLPPGWLVGRGLSTTSGEASAALGLARRREEPRAPRLRFVGGLTVDRAGGWYLEGEIPDIVIPSVAASGAVVVDGTTVDLPVRDGTVSLAPLGLAPGRHHVRHGEGETRLDVVRGCGALTADGTGTIGRRVGDPLALIRGIETGSTDAWCGALGASVPGVRPVLLHRSASRHVLLGARPGQVEEVPSTGPVPEWQERLGLYVQHVEHVASFEVCVQVEYRTHREQARVRVLFDAQGEGEPLADHDLVARWRAELLALPEATDPWEASVLTMLRSAAPTQTR